MALYIEIEKRPDGELYRLAGRLDAHWAVELENQPPRAGGLVVIDLSAVDYLSSAGVRIFVSWHKVLHAAGGRLVLAAPQPYCREVLRISGLDQFLEIPETVPAAADRTAGDSVSGAAGTWRFRSGSDTPGAIEVLGRIEDVLAARITEDLVRERKFSATEYSLGLGALGPSTPAVMPYLGEMMTIGGTMVWLPTDGNDTPDFLVPRADSDAVVIRTGFNASLAGPFNEYAEFVATEESGVALADLYEDLFRLSRARRPDFRGVLGLALRAEVGDVFGCGVVRSPIAAQAPANGRWITDPSNYAEWFEVDETPRHRNVSGLIVGVGLDLTADLGAFDAEYLNAAFYLNPGNAEPATCKLHNHGVFFEPFAYRPTSLEEEIDRIVTEGAFVDMRHLFDRTTIRRALVGIVYVQEFRPEPVV